MLVAKIHVWAVVRAQISPTSRGGPLDGNEYRSTSPVPTQNPLRSRLLNIHNPWAAPSNTVPSKVGGRLDHFGLVQDYIDSHKDLFIRISKRIWEQAEYDVLP